MENREHGPINPDQKLIQEMRRMAIKISEFQEDEQQEFIRFIAKLRKEVGEEEIQKCKLFHATTGSTTSEEKSPNMDLPGKPIENFVRELYEKCKDKKAPY